METIRVLIAEDNPALLRRYQSIIQKEPDMELLASAHSGYEVVMLAALHRPDVVLMDIEMESREAGLSASNEILRQLPATQIVILTVYEDDEFVFSAFRAGVADYVLKDVESREIAKSVRDAYYHRSAIRPIIAEKLRREFVNAKRREENYLSYLTLIKTLTDSEMDVLLLLAQGKQRGEICELRHVELNTVKSQIHSLLRKLDLPSVQQAVHLVRTGELQDLMEKLLSDKKDIG